MSLMPPDDLEPEESIEELSEEFGLEDFDLSTLRGKVPYYCEATCEIRVVYVVLAENKKEARRLAESALDDIDPEDHISFDDTFNIACVYSIDSDDTKEVVRVEHEEPLIFATESTESDTRQLDLNFGDVVDLLKRIPQPYKPSKNQTSFGFDDEASQGAGANGY